MPDPFNVVTDRRGRINHFVSSTAHSTRILPENMAEYLDGGERLTYRYNEYGLTPDGSMISVGVEIPPAVKLGSGVLIASGTSFHMLDELDEENHAIEIGDRTRIEGTEIHDLVSIGNSSIVRARRIGPLATLGSNCRLFSNVEIGSGAVLGDSVKIHERSAVGADARIGFGVRLRYNTRVGEGANIGPNVTVGESMSGDTTQSGPVIPAGAVLPGRGEI